MAEDVPDFDELEAALRVVGYSARLELLHKLRFPRPLADLRVPARQAGSDGRAAAVMSRQSLMEHLQKLMAVGVVRPAGSDGAGQSKAYVVNAPRLYQLTEDFRRVGSVLAARTAASMDATVERDADDAHAHGGAVTGPRLVLVHGLLEGKAFPLVDETLAAHDGEAGWTIGRRADASVALDYDPYVSLVNSVVTRDGDGFRLRDVGPSRNGTTVNWRPVDAGVGARLAPGAVVGVGRSLLVYQTDG